MIHSDIPLSCGMGSSTADCLAAIQAAAAALGRRLPPELQARLVVDSEGASDGIMYPDQAVIFAHREGVLLEPLGALPSFEVLGFDSDPDGGGVDTLDFEPARYSSREIEAFRGVFMTLRRGVKLQDAALIGRAATASAIINQRFLPKPRFDELLAIADRTGCLGLQVAHSGTVLGLLLDNTAADHDARVAQVRRHLAEIGFWTTWRFNTLTRPPSTSATSIEGRACQSVFSRKPKAYRAIARSTRPILSRFECGSRASQAYKSMKAVCLCKPF